MLLGIDVKMGGGPIEIGEGQRLLMKEVNSSIGETKGAAKRGRNSDLKWCLRRRSPVLTEGLGMGLVCGQLRGCDAVIADIGEDPKHVRVERADGVAERGQRNRCRERYQTKKV